MELKHKIDVDPEAILEEWRPEPGSRLFTAVERLKTNDEDLHRHEVRETELRQQLAEVRTAIGGIDPFMVVPEHVAHLLSQQSAIELLLERVRPRTASLLSQFDLAVNGIKGFDRALQNIHTDLLRERNRVNGFLTDRDWQKRAMGEKMRESFHFLIDKANKQASGFVGRDLFTFEEMFPEEEEAELVAA